MRASDERKRSRRDDRLRIVRATARHCM